MNQLQSTFEYNNKKYEIYREDSDGYKSPYEYEFVLYEVTKSDSSVIKTATELEEEGATRPDKGGKSWVQQLKDYIIDE